MKTQQHNSTVSSHFAELTSRPGESVQGRHSESGASRPGSRHRVAGHGRLSVGLQRVALADDWKMTMRTHHRCHRAKSDAGLAPLEFPVTAVWNPCRPAESIGLPRCTTARGTASALRQTRLANCFLHVPREKPGVGLAECRVFPTAAIDHPPAPGCSAPAGEWNSGGLGGAEVL